MNTPLNKFTTAANPNQLQAIEHYEGPMLIIAGPGSGKTFTLVERIVYLVTQKNVDPRELLILTFTEKAATELKTRVSNKFLELRIRSNVNEMYMGTFHSIALRILEEYHNYTRLKRSYVSMDQFDQQFFFYQRISEYDKITNLNDVIPVTMSSWMRSEALMKWMNKLTEEALEPAGLKLASDTSIRVLGEALELYRNQLEDENALDFSMMQYLLLRLLIDHPDVKEELRKRFRFIMVDEYQDTNSVQELLLNELCGTSNPNLCVVGDDDQGLYRFRGATIRNILEFDTKYPQGQCKRIALNTNYRSHPEIISYYNEWMGEQNWNHSGKTFRLQKNIVARQDQFTNMPVVLKVSSDSDKKDDYHREVYSFLLSLKGGGHLKDWNQIAFLFRSVKNSDVIALAKYLESKGIPVYSPRANMFFERDEIKLIIGALLFLFPQYARIRQNNN